MYCAAYEIISPISLTTTSVFAPAPCRGTWNLTTSCSIAARSFCSSSAYSHKYVFSINIVSRKSSRLDHERRDFIQLADLATVVFIVWIIKCYCLWETRKFLALVVLATLYLSALSKCGGICWPLVKWFWTKIFRLLQSLQKTSKGNTLHWLRQYHAWCQKVNKTHPKRYFASIHFL